MSDIEVVKKSLGKNQVELTVKVLEARLTELKKHALEGLQPEVEAPGFRKGKVPLKVVEKQVKPEALQSKFLDEALAHTLGEAVAQEKLRVLDQPKINITAFVPYSQLEYTAEVLIVPPIKLADYKKIKKSLKVPKIEADEVNKVVENLRSRLAEKKPVERAAKNEDEVIIDFAGTDKDGKEVAGAKGADYPLVLGSKKFIPGFEEKIVGLKKDDNKEFAITFPKDYAHKPLAGAKVTFAVTVKTVNELVLPKADDEFAKKVGPFDSLKALKQDIEGQISQEKRNEATNKLKDDIIGDIVKGSTIDVPDLLVDDQMKAIREDFTKNLTYRGITFPEYLEQNNMSEEEFTKKELRPKAVNRVKAGLVLSEIAEKEQLTVSPEELDIRIQLLKGQNASHANEFDKPAARRDVASRMLTEKTVDKLVDYASK